MRIDKIENKIKTKLNKKAKKPESTTPKEVTEEQVEAATSNLEPDKNSMGSRG